MQDPRLSPKQLSRLGSLSFSTAIGQSQPLEPRRCRGRKGLERTLSYPSSGLPGGPTVAHSRAYDGQGWTAGHLPAYISRDRIMPLLPRLAECSPSGLRTGSPCRGLRGPASFGSAKTTPSKRSPGPREPVTDEAGERTGWNGGMALDLAMPLPRPMQRRVCRSRGRGEDVPPALDSHSTSDPPVSHALPGIPLRGWLPGWR